MSDKVRNSRALMIANQCIKHVLQINKDPFFILKKRKVMKKNLSQKDSLYIHVHVSIENMEYIQYINLYYIVIFFFSYFSSLI